MCGPDASGDVIVTLAIIRMSATAGSSVLNRHGIPATDASSAVAAASNGNQSERMSATSSRARRAETSAAVAVDGECSMVRQSVRIGSTWMRVMGLSCATMRSDSRSNGSKVGTNRLIQLLGQWSDGSGPLYHQLADRLAASIDDGTLRVGDRLPPERTLADALSVSRGTVVRAYDELAAGGSVTRLQGSGTTVQGNELRAGPLQHRFVGERLWAPDLASVDLLKAIPTMLPVVAELISSIDLASHADDLDEAEPLGWWRLREGIADLPGRPRCRF